MPLSNHVSEMCKEAAWVTKQGKSHVCPGAILSISSCGGSGFWLETSPSAAYHHRATEDIHWEI